MASLKKAANCIGLAGPISVTIDFFGYRTGARLSSLSLGAQIRLLRGRHIHLNLIRTAAFTYDQQKEIDVALQVARRIYATVGLGIGRIKRFVIPPGYEVINDHSEAQDLWNDYNGPAGAIDVFLALSMLDGKKGMAPDSGGSCDKDSKDDSGCVIPVESNADGIGYTLGQAIAHEVGHFLNLEHEEGLPDNLMFPTVPNGGKLYAGQGGAMALHCSINNGCQPYDKEIEMSNAPVPKVTTSDNAPADGSDNAGEASLTRLRQVVAGTSHVLPRSVAMAALVRSDFPNRHRDFEAVLTNEREAPEWRYLAATSLGTIASPVALTILLRALDIRHERVLAGVMKALGRIGDRSALDAIVEVREYATGAAARHARFAATLIAHRIGATDVANREPPARPLDLDRHCARAFRIAAADAVDAERCLRALANQSFGIEFAERPMCQLRCGQRSSMILVNRDWVAARSTRLLATRPAFLGAVASRMRESPSYVVTHLILTAPGEGDNGLRLRVYRPSGELAFSGTGQLTDDGVAFSIGAVSRPGAFAVSFEGTFADGRLEVATALATAFAQVAKQEPVEDL